MNRALWLGLAWLSSGCADVLGVEQKELLLPPGPGARPPPRPASEEQGPFGKRAFAVRKLYLGARDPETGEFDELAWRKMGFDIDGVDTTEKLAASEAPGTCLPVVRVSSDSLLDGFAGRDNNFGSKMLDIFADFAPGLDGTENSVNADIDKGGPTLIVTLEDLHEGPDDPHVEVGILLSARKDGFDPAWNGVDRFPIDDRTLVPGTMQPRTLFANGYMSGNTVVSGDFNAPPDTAIHFPLDPDTDAAILTPLAFTLTLSLNESHDMVLSSTLSTAVTIDELVHMFDSVKDNWGGCSFDPDPIIRPYADLRSDRPSFLDPTSTTECDAMSWAMQFDWEPIRIPANNDVFHVNPAPGPCSE